MLLRLKKNIYQLNLVNKNMIKTQIKIVRTLLKSTNIQYRSFESYIIIIYLFIFNLVWNKLHFQLYSTNKKFINYKIRKEIEMSKIFQKIGDAIAECDWFAAPILLRFHGEEDKKTKTGGFISLLLIIFLASAFSSSWMDALNKKQIKCQTEIIREANPSPFNISSSNFMLAIGSPDINLLNQTTNKYFTLQVNNHQLRNGNEITYQIINLQPCKISHLNGFELSYQKIYNQYNLQNYLCLPLNFSLEVEGKFVSEKFKYLEILVKYCRDDGCFGNNLTSLKYKINFFFINTLLNPTLQQPISYYLQDKYENTLNNEISLETNIYISQYSIQTDESLWPIQKIVESSGFFVDRTEKEEFVRSALNTDCAARVYFRKSDQKIKISRVYKKLDDVLSYLGGLFGILAAFFGFFITNYNKCCYELEMSNKLFKKTDEQNTKDDKNHDITQLRQAVHCTKGTLIDSGPQQSLRFNFWTFTKYTISKILFSFLSPQRWLSMYTIHQKIKQTKNQMNIDTILQKIFFCQRAFECMFNESQLTLLMLQQKTSIKELKQKRLIMNFEDEEFIERNLRQQNQNKDSQEGVKQKEEDNVMMAIYESIMNVEKQAGKGDQISIKILAGLRKDILEKYEKYKQRNLKGNRGPVRLTRLTTISRFQGSIKNLVSDRIIQLDGNPTTFKTYKSGLLKPQQCDVSHLSSSSLTQRKASVFTISDNGSD